MLDNELLLVNTKNYHYVVTVAELQASYGFANYDDDIGGSISPSHTTDGNQILELNYNHVSNQIVFRVKGRLDSYSDLYLGRSDIKKNFGQPTTGSTGASNGEGYAVWRDDDPVLFTAEDVGKKIPIWLSYSPPHTNITLVSCNSSCYGRVA